jgi:hypothetical protein
MREGYGHSPHFAGLLMDACVLGETPQTFRIYLLFQNILLDHQCDQ